MDREIGEQSFSNPINLKQQKSEFRKAKAELSQAKTEAKRRKCNKDTRKKGPLFDPNVLKHPLILYPKNEQAVQPGEVQVVVDPRLGDELEDHQREGVTKMYQVLSKYCNSAPNRGFILADKMGLGKTVQTIAVLWTLLTQGPEWDVDENNRKHEIKKAIVVCPKGVIHVWNDQFKKWLEPSGQNDATNFTISTETLDDRKNGKKKAEVTRDFMNASNKTQVLILSFETFVALSKPDGPLRQNTDNVINLLIIDEAHYIRNADTQRCDAITSFAVENKLCLTGTPLQNNLMEYYTIINYIQPNVLGSELSFKSTYVSSITKWVENKKHLQGKQLLDEIKTKVNPFFLRRTKNMFVEANLTEYIVCCKLEQSDEDGANTQLNLYNKFVDMYQHTMDYNRQRKRDKLPQLNGFQAIGFLKALCSHPALVYKKCKQYQQQKIYGADDLLKTLEDELQENKIDYTLSAKLRVLHSLLISIRNNVDRNDRVVIVSYYTQTLDVIEKYLKENKEKGYHFVRYDGSTSGRKREEITRDFNDSTSQGQFILTLSSRAGGCGISLIGANHLIMFDPDWNPANDEQAMSRIYRQGQKKDCFIYRFVTTASIEENIFHRQIAKKLLAGAVLNDFEDDSNIFNFDDTDLYQQQRGNLEIGFVEEMQNSERVSKLIEKINVEEISLSHSMLDCKRCDEHSKRQVHPPKLNMEEHSDSLQLEYWNHHFTAESLPAECEAIHDAWIEANYISFIFRKKSEGVDKAK